MSARLLLRGLGAPLLTLAVLAAPAGRANATPPQRPELKKLHVLVVVDTYDARAKRLGMLLDQDNVVSFLRRTVPADRLSVTIMEGRDVTRSNVLGYYESLEVGPEDGLLFYYSGHGAIDRQKGHALTLFAGRQYLLRADLLAAMKAKGAGLVMVLTDCCSTYANLRPEQPLAARGASRGPGAPAEIDPVVSRLFFRQRGVIDITAAEPGRPASGDTEVGGFFTASLVELLRRGDPRDEAYSSWDAFFPRLKAETARLSRERRGDRAMHAPVAYQLPGARPGPRADR
jgi:hypothetical protein